MVEVDGQVDVREYHGSGPCPSRSLEAQQEQGLAQEEEKVRRWEHRVRKDRIANGHKSQSSKMGLNVAGEQVEMTGSRVKRRRGEPGPTPPPTPLNPPPTSAVTTTITTIATPT